MKTLMGVIALMLALLFGATNGVLAAEQKSQPTSGERKGQPGQGPLYPSSPKLLTGMVTEVNQTARTFTARLIDDQGKELGKSASFSTAKLKVLPEVGKIIGITYNENPGVPLEATTIKLRIPKPCGEYEKPPCHDWGLPL